MVTLSLIILGACLILILYGIQEGIKWLIKKLKDM